jgi:hypothetical protein
MSSKNISIANNKLGKKKKKYQNPDGNLKKSASPKLELLTCRLRMVNLKQFCPHIRWNM